MSPSELSHMLNVALRDLESAISLTLTSFSADNDQLQKLLITALAAGRRHNVQLKEIELPLRDFRHLGRRFRNIPIKDSGDPDVLRLQFEPPANYRSLDVAA